MRAGKKTFEVWFWRIDPWNACFDGDRLFEVTAVSEQEALKLFREECGDSALAQFVQTKEEVAL